MQLSLVALCNGSQQLFSDHYLGGGHGRRGGSALRRCGSWRVSCSGSNRGWRSWSTRPMG